MAKDFNGNGMKVFKSFDTMDEKKEYNDYDDDENKNNDLNVKFEELNNFRREKDLYDYIKLFLDNNKTVISTLIIQCDPIPNNGEKEKIFTHYLHAQYLIEKANSQS